MPRPRRTVPWLAERNGWWYVYWHDTVLARTKRRALKVRDQGAAELLLTQFLRAGRSVPATKLPPAADPWLWMARRMCKRAKENAKAKGRPYYLTPEFVLQLLQEQRFCCAVSGVPLALPTKKRDPWAPSLDQIAPGEGYTITNVRIVCMLVNTAMNGWGELPLIELMRKWRAGCSQYDTTTKAA